MTEYTLQEIQDEILSVLTRAEGEFFGTKPRETRLMQRQSFEIINMLDDIDILDKNKILPEDHADKYQEPGSHI